MHHRHHRHDRHIITAICWTKERVNSIRTVVCYVNGNSRVYMHWSRQQSQNDKIIWKISWNSLANKWVRNTFFSTLSSQCILIIVLRCALKHWCMLRSFHAFNHCNIMMCILQIYNKISYYEPHCFAHKIICVVVEKKKQKRNHIRVILEMCMIIWDFEVSAGV